jgi:hypothetical protein
LYALDTYTQTEGSSSWLYYYITAPPGFQTLTVRAVREVGFVDLYSTHCPSTSLYRCSHLLPNTTHYLSTTRDHNSATLTIPRIGIVCCITIIDTTILNIHTITHTTPIHLHLHHPPDSTSSLYLVGVLSSSYYAAYQISAAFEGEDYRTKCL